MVDLMKGAFGILTSLLLAGVLTTGALAQTASSARYDGAIEQKVSQQLQDKSDFQNVKSNVEDGIVTLTGTVDLYQHKLDAAKKIRKVQNVQGVRNLIEVAGPNVADQTLHEQIAKKLYYERVGYYDSAFNYFTLGVNNGVVTVGGETYNDVGRDDALATIQRMPGVKDVVNEVKVSPVSLFDDSIRVRAARAIYRDPSLGKYSVDPARPIRIIVNNGNVSLYGTVNSAMDKTIAGIRVNSVPGAFSVQNNLTVER
jgi:hyperosmotically inducible periplasmic protein